MTRAKVIRKRLKVIPVLCFIPAPLLTAVTVETQPEADLSLSAYIILAIVLLGLVGGLSWCFYRALTATDSSAKPQLSEDVGDENDPTSQNNPAG